MPAEGRRVRQTVSDRSDDLRCAVRHFSGRALRMAGQAAYVRAPGVIPNGASPCATRHAWMRSAICGPMSRTRRMFLAHSLRPSHIFNACSAYWWPGDGYRVHQFRRTSVVPLAGAARSSNFLQWPVRCSETLSPTVVAMAKLPVLLSIVTVETKIFTIPSTGSKSAW
jgi:hypothetical protein